MSTLLTPDFRIEPSSKYLICVAPDDVFIESIIGNEIAVNTGTILAQLKSPTLDQFSSRLDGLLENIQISEKQFIDGRAEKTIEAAKQSYENLLKIEELTKENYSILKAAHESGLRHYDEVIAANLEYLKVITDRINANNKLIELSGRHEDTKARLNSARDALERELQIMNYMRNKLTVTTPKNGEFRSIVGGGEFLKKGEIFGVIIYE